MRHLQRWFCCLWLGGLLLPALCGVPAVRAEPEATVYWVDAASGNDANTGLASASAFRTIQRAAALAGPGTTIYIRPGVYREAIRPAQSGTAAAPIRYVAEQGWATVLVRGSDPSSSLSWTQLTANTIGLPAGVDPTKIYYADLSGWGLTETPRFVVQLTGNGQGIAARLPLAREPDEFVQDEWQTAKYWWAADGGSGVAGCTPNPDNRYCDDAWNSSTQLTDRTTDTSPSGIEAGNLTTLGNLTGATLVALDNRSGHYLYRRTITAHDTSAGRITISPAAQAESNFRLGWGTKYYVENSPKLLDRPGEWWYDKTTKRLYLWPPVAGNPAAQPLEISRRDVGFDFNNRSYITLDGLTVELFNQNAVQIANSSSQSSRDIQIRNSILRYANRGVLIDQGAESGTSGVTSGFTLEYSEVSYMDTRALHMYYWWGNGNAASAFTRAGVTNTTIRYNELHHLSFRPDSDNAVGSLILYADHFYLVGNHIHDVAHNGFQFSYSLIQSDKEYGFAPSEIKTGDILIQGNLFEQACQLTADCGALKLWGNPPDNHVYRNVLITGNVFRNTFGWSSISEKRGLWSLGTIQGMGGFGLYTDMASGFHVYRNIAYNNAHVGFMLSGVWDNGDLIYYNNIAANSVYGFYFTRSNLVNSTGARRFYNNIILNNEAYGITFNDGGQFLSNWSRLSLDYNLYYLNGWNTGDIYKPGAITIYRDTPPNEYYQTLAQIQAASPWEDHGVAGDPLFKSYNPTDHALFDGSWPNFELQLTGPNAINKGTTTLPTSLTALLTQFGVTDTRYGSAYDIGRYEQNGFLLLADPPARSVEPGTVVTYSLYLYPTDLTLPVTLVSAPAPAGLLLRLEPTVISLTQRARLVVTDTIGGPALPGRWYGLPFTATWGAYTSTCTVGLLLGGTRTYLPLVARYR